MKHPNISRKMSRVFGGFVLSLMLILVACGGDADEPTPTATSDSGVAAVPTTPPLENTPEADVSEEEITILESEIPGTSEASTPDPGVGTSTDDGPVDLTATEDVGTPSADQELAVETDSATPPSGDQATPGSAGEELLGEGTENESTGRVRTGNETFDNPGDGTGGSGMPAEQDSSESESDTAATPSASPVAQLSIAGCEVPDVPGFLGDNPTFVLIEDVNFRTGPGVECDLALDEPIGVGQTIEVIGGPVTQADDDSEWVQIEINGVPGWISIEFIEPVE